MHGRIQAEDAMRMTRNANECNANECNANDARHLAPSSSDFTLYLSAMITCVLVCGRVGVRGWGVIAVFDQVAHDCVCTSGWQHLWAPLCISLRPVPAASAICA